MISRTPCDTFRWPQLGCIGAGVALLLVVTAAIASAAPFAAPTPAFEWRTATPESAGLSSAKLDALRDHLAKHATRAFVLICDDAIVCEWYSRDHSASKPHSGASMAKAIVGGVSVAVALSDGRMSLSDSAAKYIPQWRGVPSKSEITIRQLASHTSGIDEAGVEGVAKADLTGWKGDFWKRTMAPPHDPFTLARDEAPLRFAPGTAKLYSNPGIAMLTYATTAALRDAPERDLRTLLRNRVMRPIGVSDEEWSVGYGKTVIIDGLPLVAAWGGASFTARATARIGRLMLREGDWDGRRLINAEAVRAVTTDPAAPPNPSLKWLGSQTGSAAIGWWRNTNGAVACLPRDSYWGAGAGHQILLVIPSHRIIAVRNGATLSQAESYDSARNALFFQPLAGVLGLDRPVR